MKLLGLIFVGLLVSCGTYKDVKVLDSKPSDCEIINKVSGTNDFGSDQAAIKNLREKALNLGGNAVYVEQIVPNGKKFEAIGSVYKCEKE